MSQLNPDFRDILSAFNAAEVEYLLVGAYAMAAYGVPRATGDIDLWVRTSPENSQRIMRALVRFGGPTQSLSAADFENPDLVFQIGIAPHRIDILTVIDGLTFDDARSNATVGRFDGIAVPVISRRDFITNKLAAGRPKDIADAHTVEMEGDNPAE